MVAIVTAVWNHFASVPLFSYLCGLVALGMIYAIYQTWLAAEWAYDSAEDACTQIRANREHTQRQLDGLAARVTSLERLQAEQNERIAKRKVEAKKIRVATVPKVA